MPAVIRRTCTHGGSVRLGPECFIWGDDFTRALSYENDPDEPDLAIIGGLTEPPLSRQEYRWLEEAFIREGLRTAIDRVIRDSDGKPLRDVNGNVVMRRLFMPMPHWPDRMKHSK